MERVKCQETPTYTEVEMGPGSETTPLLSVVVPTRNEADNVETLVERLARVLTGIPVELIFVDDSSDATPTLLANLSASPPASTRIRVLHRDPPHQTGLGSAAAAGLKLATGTLVAVMDGDLQHPPELLGPMVRRLEEADLDVVVASRYTRGGSARGLNGPARVLVSWVSKLVAQLLFREARKTSDPLSGYFLCRRAAIEGVEFRPIGFKILLEVLVCTAGARVGDVPLTFAPRHAGRSNASMAQGLAFLRHLWSLLLHVPGSARVWKYGAVGAAGLALFLGVLAAVDAFGLGPWAAWAVAFAISLSLNWQLNRLVTFADVASPFTAGRGRPIYLPVALVGGAANLAMYVVLLVTLHTGVLLAGLAGALVAMVLNYSVQRGMLRRPPRVVGSMVGGSLAAVADRVRRQLHASVYVVQVPAGPQGLETIVTGSGERPPRELLRVEQTARPMMLAEAPSSRPQARTDIGVDAWMSIPVLEGDQMLGILVVYRRGRAFGGEELDAALRLLRSQARPLPAGVAHLLAGDKTAT